MLTHMYRLLLLILISATSSLGAGDPVLGTWKLNVAASTYSPGPAPTSEARVYEQQSDGAIKVTIRSVDANSHSTVIEVAANYDDKEYPVTGDSRADTTSLKKINEYKAESKLLHGKVVVAMITREISHDGQRMTITYKGADSDQGLQLNNTAVYDKQ